MKISKGLRQAYAIQDFTFDAAMSLRASLTQQNGQLKIAREDAQAIASLVKALDTCQERIRIHRGKPLPGTLRPEKGKKKRVKPITSEPEIDRTTNSIVGQERE